MNARRALLRTALAATLAAAPALHAQPAGERTRDNAVAVYGALRDGGSFIERDSDRKLRVDGSAAGAFSVDLGLDGWRQLQFYVSQQRSNLRLDTATAASATPPPRLPLTVTYLHLGGTNFFDGPIGRGPYVAGGIGATLLKPGRDGFGSELRPSLNIGLGWQQPLGPLLALRLEARGYFTLVDSSGGLFCDGGCVVQIKGDAFTQGEVQLGLSARF
jgi:hypothetical protein